MLPKLCLRPGSVSPGLITTLVVVALGVGGYWVYRASTTEEVILTNPDATSAIQMVVTCRACDYTDTIPWTDLKGWERRDGAYVCPVCGEAAVDKQRQDSPSAQIISP